jgi:hypothetical protein
VPFGDILGKLHDLSNPPKLQQAWGESLVIPLHGIDFSIELPFNFMCFGEARFGSYFNSLKVKLKDLELFQTQLDPNLHPMFPNP